jgi:hypothetical protein
MNNLPEITNLVTAVNDARLDGKISIPEHAATIAYLNRLIAAEGITWSDVEDQHAKRNS